MPSLTVKGNWGKYLRMPTLLELVDVGVVGRVQPIDQAAVFGPESPDLGRVAGFQRVDEGLVGGIELVYLLRV